jgi:hypothetical protein
VITYIGAQDMIVRPKTARGRLNLEWCNMYFGGTQAWWAPEIYDNYRLARAKILAICLTVGLAATAHAEGFSSEGVPQFPKSGGCNAFWMPGNNDGDDRHNPRAPGATDKPRGQWYAINDTDFHDPDDPNKIGRWQLISAAIAAGQEMWITDPSFVGMPQNIARTILCSVPHKLDGPKGPQALPNAVIYAYPSKPDAD